MLSIADFVSSLPAEDCNKFFEDRLSGKFYVYVLIRSNGSIFYVGKGQGNRINAHEAEAHRGIQSHKCNIIRQEWENGQEIIKQKVAFFDDEEDAYELEILLIEFFGRENLANLCEGGEGGARPGAGRHRIQKIKVPIISGVEHVLIGIPLDLWQEFCEAASDEITLPGFEPTESDYERYADTIMLEELRQYIRKAKKNEQQ